MRCKECGRSDIPSGAGWCCWCGKKLIKTRTKKKEIKIPEPRQLKSGNWFIQLRIDGQSVSITEPTERACCEKARAMKAGLISMETKHSKMTIKQAIDKYIGDKSNVLSPSTIRGYETIRDTRFKTYIDKDIYSMTPHDWQKMVNDEVPLCSAKTICNAWRLVSTSVKYVTGKSVEVHLPQIVPHETKVFTPDEILTFCDAIKGNKCEIALLLGLSSLRRSEILGLQWENVDLENQIIHVSGSIVLNKDNERVYKDTNKNTSSNRTVPIRIPQLYDALCQVENKEGFVVKQPANTIRNALEITCRDNDLTRITLHGLRHTYVSLAAHLGIPLDEVMQTGGWSNDKVVRRIYTHIYATDIERSNDKTIKFYNRETDKTNDDSNKESVQNANENANET